MTRRRLRPDEVDLWRKVTETTERMHPEGKPFEAPMPRPKPMKHPTPALREFHMGQGAASAGAQFDLVPSVSDRVAAAPVRMDRKTHQKLKRGKVAPEGKLDLHGMTMAEAHPRLLSFILRAQADGKRLVLVITGKGRQSPDDGPIPVRKGILRHQVPHWLSLPPLAQAVLQVAEAHLKHGGGGAFYVYLRRHR
jgi:DNA-nicking Smr family endonuclease